MKINHVHHIAINTKDIEKSIAFYRDILGFPVVDSVDMGGETLVYLRVARDTFIELFDLRGRCIPGAPPADEYVGGRHVAFDVDDLFAWERHLKKKGVPFVLEHTEMPKLKKRGLLVRDPNGVVIELNQDL